MKCPTKKHATMSHELRVKHHNYWYLSDVAVSWFSSSQSERQCHNRSYDIVIDCGKLYRLHTQLHFDTFPYKTWITSYVDIKSLKYSLWYLVLEILASDLLNHSFWQEENHIIGSSTPHSYDDNQEFTTLFSCNVFPCFVVKYNTFYNANIYARNVSDFIWWNHLCIG